MGGNLGSAAFGTSWPDLFLIPWARLGSGQLFPPFLTLLYWVWLTGPSLSYPVSSLWLSHPLDRFP